LKLLLPSPSTFSKAAGEPLPLELQPRYARIKKRLDGMTILDRPVSLRCRYGCATVESNGDYVPSTASRTCGGNGPPSGRGAFELRLARGRPRSSTLSTSTATGPGEKPPDARPPRSVARFELTRGLRGLPLARVSRGSAAGSPSAHGADRIPRPSCRWGAAGSAVTGRHPRRSSPRPARSVMLAEPLPPVASAWGSRPSPGLGLGFFASPRWSGPILTDSGCYPRGGGGVGGGGGEGVGGGGGEGGRGGDGGTEGVNTRQW
jgi:hypothetical protein